MPNPWTFILGAAVGLCAAVFWAITQDANSNRQSHSSSGRSRGPPQERQYRGWDDDDYEPSDPKASSGPQERSRNGNNKLVSRGKNLPSCAICMETFTDLVNGGRNLCSLSCGHIFCEKCIRRTLEGSPTCPKCRKEASADELQYVYL